MKQELEKKIKVNIPWYEYAQVKHFCSHSALVPASLLCQSSFENLMLMSPLANKGLVFCHNLELTFCSFSPGGTRT